jgi:hypothetical protein
VVSLRRLAARLSWRRKLSIVGRVDAADEIPETLPRLRAVIVGSEALPTWLAFDCPCMTGHRIMLNLDKRRRPAWTFTNNKKPTIHPSVDSRRPEMRCHYWVRQGKITWVKDIGERDD